MTYKENKIKYDKRSVFVSNLEHYHLCVYTNPILFSFRLTLLSSLLLSDVVNLSSSNVVESPDDIVVGVDVFDRFVGVPLLYSALDAIGVDDDQALSVSKNRNEKKKRC